MIIVKLQGGLGNQMFQYAAGKYLAKKHNVELKMDLQFLLDRTPIKNFVFRDYDLDIFGIYKEAYKSNFSIAFGRNRKLSRFKYFLTTLFNSNLPKYVRENPYCFDNKFFKISDNCYLEGYWQSYRYFDAIESEIRSDFQILENFSENGVELLNQIKNSNSVCINVRRADFVNLKQAEDHHGFCDLNYFQSSINIINKRVTNPKFFVFSDDVGWCIENFKFLKNVTVVGHEYAGRKFSQYLNLMKNSKHFIIPNSTFGWWAAWLGENPEKIVIAPEKWYVNKKMDTRELLPKSWLKVDN
jgi:hypothetical protein